MTTVSISLMLSAAFLLALTACSTPTPSPPAKGGSAVPFQEGVPGVVIVNTVDVSARITAIDKVNRKITLLKHDGEKSIVKVGPEAVNFDRIKEGEPEIAVAVVLMFFFFKSSNRVSFRGILLRIDAVGYQ